MTHPGGRPEERRAAILQAAKRVFAQNGFHAAKMGDVARQAGTSYGSVYWYFRSKEELFHGLMEDQEQALRQHIEQAMASTPKGARQGEERFRRSVQATFEFFETDRDTAKLLFRDPLGLGDRFDRHLAGIYEGFITDLEKSIAGAQQAGHLVDAPPRMIAFSVAAMVSGLALRRLVTDDGMSAEVVAGFVVGMLLDGLKPRRDRRRDK